MAFFLGFCPLQRFVGCCHISVTGGEVLVVVAYDVPHAANLPDGVCMGCKVFGAKVVGGLYAHRIFYLCDAEGEKGTFVHIMFDTEVVMFLQCRE